MIFQKSRLTGNILIKGIDDDSSVKIKETEGCINDMISKDLLIDIIMSLELH